MARPQQCSEAPEIALRTLRLAAQAGEINALNPLPVGPGSSHGALTTSDARSIKERQAEPKIPRRIDSRPAKPLLFNHIADWCSDVRFCAAEPIEAGLAARQCSLPPAASSAFSVCACARAGVSRLAGRI